MARKADLRAAGCSLEDPQAQSRTPDLQWISQQVSKFARRCITAVRIRQQRIRGFTSVGTAAIVRFARPICYQDFPTRVSASGAAIRDPYSRPFGPFGLKNMGTDPVIAQRSSTLPDAAAIPGSVPTFFKAFSGTTESRPGRRSTRGGSGCEFQKTARPQVSSDDK